MRQTYWYVPGAAVTFTTKWLVPFVGTAPELRSDAPLNGHGVAVSPHAPGAGEPAGGLVGAATAGLICNWPGESPGSASGATSGLLCQACAGVSEGVSSVVVCSPSGVLAHPKSKTSPSCTVTPERGK